MGAEGGQEGGKRRRQELAEQTVLVKVLPYPKQGKEVDKTIFVIFAWKF